MPVGMRAVGAHDDLTLLPDLAGLALFIEQVDVVPGGGLAHAARLRLHPGEDRDGHRHLGLPVALRSFRPVSSRKRE